MEKLVQNMLFERIMEQFFGARTRGIATSRENNREVKKRFKEAIRKLIKHANTIETNIDYKEKILSQLESLEKKAGKEYLSQETILRLLSLCGLLFGYDEFDGKIHTNVYYCQRSGKEYTGFSGLDLLRKMESNENNIIAYRKKLVKSLKEEKLSNYKISVILNTSEKEIGKLTKK
ncbi:hypothetical protein KKH43_01870 [Patescibacteria group bacterium]|nr:hypothetical protein [Patescibacteria group bacterium]